MVTRFLCFFALSTMALRGGVVGSAVGGLPQAPPPSSVQQPRDPGVRKPPVGTGTITGRVTDAETGVPLRRALVNLSGNTRRATFTDLEGRYQFSNLPRGSYTIHVNPGPHRGGYQSRLFGIAPIALGVAILPKPLELGDDQKLENIDVALPRAGVIAGRVTDSFGEPAARVQVSAFLLPPGAEPRQVGGTATDDLGQYRLFGLAPGDYVVMAAVAMGGMRTEIEGEPIGFAPTYAPGTPVRSDAMRIRVGSGMEMAADIRLTETRVYSISGTAMNSKGEPSRGLTVMLIRSEGSGEATFGTSTSPGGTFSIRSVPPGQYELVARSVPTNVSGDGPRMPYVSLPVDVSTGDVDGVVLVTQPSPVIAGEIVFEEKPPQFHQAIISAQTTGRVPLVGPPRVQVKNTQFTMSNVFAPVTLHASFPAGPTWGLKAILLRGEDITDVPTVFTANDSGHIRVVFTPHAAVLEGSVAGEDGKPTELAAVVVFGQDPSTWTARSSYYRNVRGLKDGKFTAAGLRQGSYFVAAVPLELSMSFQSQPSPELLESLSKVATPITLTAGETRSLDLVVVRIQQEDH
jgi:hypothetical protein